MGINLEIYFCTLCVAKLSTYPSLNFQFLCTQDILPSDDAKALLRYQRHNLIIYL